MDLLASVDCVAINTAGSYLWHDFPSFGPISRNGVDGLSGRSIFRGVGVCVHMCKYKCLSVCIHKRHTHAEDKLTLDLCLSDCPPFTDTGSFAKPAACRFSCSR